MSAAILTATERKIEAVWKQSLDRQSINPTESYFDLGGDSLMMIDMLMQLTSEFGIEIDPGILFEDATLRGLAARIDQLRSAPPATEQGAF